MAIFNSYVNLPEGSWLEFATRNRFMFLPFFPCRGARSILVRRRGIDGSGSQGGALSESLDSAGMSPMNVGRTIINHPPVTIFMGINHQKRGG